jgi:large subunit ribosomal protein L21
MYAIIETGGKQYRVEPGSTLRVEKLAGNAGDTVELNRICLVQSETGLVVGHPWVAGATVKAEVLGQARTRSMMVFKKKRRKNYRRTKGHRQAYTHLRVIGIETT